MDQQKTTNEIGWNFNNSYAQLPDLLYSKVEPTTVQSPELVIFNASLANSLGLNEQPLKKSEGAEVCAGNKLPEGSFPLAQAYAGHQFGHFNMLGDGRAILLGEQVTPNGERYDIQLKGSGRTPYSRGGDGRATLGPMLREYIISEAMHGLRIPTTRSLAVVKTGEDVIRETYLPGAILSRVATSHIRVGTFQYVAHWGTPEDLKKLTDYTIDRHYPYVKDKENIYLSFLHEVIKRQAELIAKWQLVGFIHGVMNTDNMTINGETIDYGPCAFMDHFDPSTVFSSIDRQGRYAYGNQPAIGGWNLARFAETLLPLLHDVQEEAVKLAQHEISLFKDMFNTHYIQGMRKKIGLFGEEDEDETLISELLAMMKKEEADYTNTFRLLAEDQLDKLSFFGTPEFEAWKEKWSSRLERQEESKASSKELMQKNNPAVIPRNHRVEEALEAAVENNDYSVMTRLLEVLKDPYVYNSKAKAFMSPAPACNEPYVTYCGT
ncbi:YdiU family protein [Aquibacillus koreensis]|uniref:Protein nucleotidyltransferase YdiU n=1 Tax=Aquibacillus koreensis TaxID=279446 RepID=A0A9X3WPI5_9BACI|nr:YdiU family protein [Aquibacillus koreensis]MCT2536943.1 YdiU family protein [Aquibacillus koreensis]MDC3421926.1 YdiU family protein [Aquibacillus koreensis]